MRSWAITAPAWMGGPGSCGTCSETYCSPKIVLGRIRADTFCGMLCTLLGSSASETVTQGSSGLAQALPEVTLTSRTSPTMRPRSLTSEACCSSLPVWSARSVTITTGGELLLVDRDRQPQQGADQHDVAEAETPALELAGERFLGHGYPANLTLTVEPQIARDRKKSVMLTTTIALRTARPTATPTPAGPPVAL